MKKKTTFRLLTLLFLAMNLFLPGTLIHAEDLQTGDDIADAVDACPIEYEGGYIQAITSASDDGSREIILATSSDKKNWKVKKTMENIRTPIPDVEMIFLGNNYIISEKENNGNLICYSTDGETWKQYDYSEAVFVDIAFNAGFYYAITEMGTVFNSPDLVEWTKVADFPSAALNKLKVTDLAVNNNCILVGHYNSTWGEKNFNNGLEIYTIKTKTWSAVKGFVNDYGVLEDLLWTGKSFVLSKKDIYDMQVPVSYFTSSGGAYWTTLSVEKVELVRALNIAMAKNTQIWHLVQRLRADISNYMLGGGMVAVRVKLNDEIIAFDNEPKLVDGRVLVPVRKLFEALGGEVVWDGDNRQVSGQIGETRIQLTIDDQTALINGSAYELDVPAKIINGSTYVPVRFIAQSSGVTVQWDSDNYQVLLYR